MRRKQNKNEKKFRIFLKLVNSAYGSPEELADFMGLYRKRIAGKGENPSVEEEIEVLKKCLDHVGYFQFEDPDGFFQFLFDKNSPSELVESESEKYDSIANSEGYFLWDAINEYSFFRQNYNSLKRIGARLETKRKFEPQIGLRKERVLRDQVMADFYLDKDGQLEIEVLTLNLFYGFRDFGRMMNCLNCSGYFVAQRTDTKYCSKECGDTYRQKKWRENPDNRERHLEVKRNTYHKHKEVINEQRRENYRTRKRVEKLRRKKKNGDI